MNNSKHGRNARTPASTQAILLFKPNRCERCYCYCPRRMPRLPRCKGHKHAQCATGYKHRNLACVTSAQYPNLYNENTCTETQRLRALPEPKPQSLGYARTFRKFLPDTKCGCEDTCRSRPRRPSTAAPRERADGSSRTNRRRG